MPKYLCATFSNRTYIPKFQQPFLRVEDTAEFIDGIVSSYSLPLVKVSFTNCVVSPYPQTLSGLPQWEWVNKKAKLVLTGWRNLYPKILFLADDVPSMTTPVPASPFFVVMATFLAALYYYKYGTIEFKVQGDYVSGDICILVQRRKTEVKRVWVAVGGVIITPDKWFLVEKEIAGLVFPYLL